MAHVAHVWSVYWSNPHTQPPDDFARVVCQVRLLVERGRGAGLCPVQIEDAMRFWNRAVSDGRLEYGAGYSVCWHIEAAPDAPPPRRLSEEAKQRIRRGRLEKRMRARYPLFAEEIINEELARRPEYFGAPKEEGDG